MIPLSFQKIGRFLPLLLLAFLANAVSAAYTPPSPPPKYWDYFNDNYFSMANRSASNGPLVVTSAGATQGTSSNTVYQQQWEVLLNLEDGTYRLVNRDSGLCLAAQTATNINGLQPVANAYTGNILQKWYLTGTGGGYWAFVNAANSLALQTDGGSPAKVTLQAVNTANTQQQWLADPVNPVDHYPKKGQCGWDGTVGSFNDSWFYNWGPAAPGNLPGRVAYVPMKHNPGWPGIGELGGGYAALHSTAKPVAVLGFNEPDRPDQANANTDQQIAIWPDLQALNVPLGSPATASTWNGWTGDFYNKISSKGYRVDFTAIHNYPTDTGGLDSYLNNVNSIANAWGRPVWITEFALTGWGGWVSWTEENCYTWLSEFLWRAEDYPNLRRYSYFAYAGDPPANPWDAIGTGAGGLLKGDNVTMTALGELYASWDADRSVKARTAYLLQGKQSMMRLSTTTANSPFPGAQASFPSPVSIRVSGAQAQWSLVESPTSGQFYIASLLDGRRLLTNGSSVTLAAPGTTGTGVQWSVSPAGNGYFYVNNLAYNVTLSSRRDNNGNGAPTAAYYGVVASGSPTDYTRFRLVKPVASAAVPTAAPAVPTAVTINPGDRRNVIQWSGAGTYYTVARSTSPAGPFTPLVTNWPTTSYVDNAAVNGTAYYYTVTASNLLGDTSAATTMVPGNPAASRAVADLEGNYKFEAGNAQDNSGNGQRGVVSGDAAFFSPGKVDGYALNFNGVNSSVQIPAVVSTDFSLAFWLRTTSPGGAGSQWYNGSGLVDAEVAGAATDYGVALVGGKVAFGVGLPDITIFSSGTVNDGAWHHVVATRDGNSGALALYIDGTLQASGAASSTPRTAPTGIRLGALQSGGGYYKGDLDEVRLYSYVLGAADAAKLAAGAGSGLVAQYNFANRSLQDGSGLGNHGAASAVTFDAPGKVNPVAASFNGSTAYATLPQSLTNDFTIAYWLQTTSAGLPGTNWWQGAGLVDGEVNGAQNDFGTSLLGGKAAFGVGNPDVTILSTGAVNDGAWHHVAATRTGSNGQMRLYLDGVLQASGTGAIGPRTAPTALALGRLLPGTNYYNGSLDDVRLYNYALTAGQVVALVNPPPAPFAVQDVGNPAMPGFAGASNGVWTVGGSGADIAGVSDQFSLTGAAQSGAGTLVARLASPVTNPDGTTTTGAKAGLMFRDGPAAGAPFVDLVYSQGQGVQFLYRPTAGGSTIQLFSNVSGVTAPCWLKLARGNVGNGSGNYFQGYYSTKTGAVPPTAAEWVPIGAYTATFATGNTLAGLAVCSRVNGTLGSATFDNFALQPNAAPTLSALADQTTTENTATAALNLAVGDVESQVASLTLTAASSNPAVLPVGNIAFGGSGAARTVQLTPAANQAGASTVTLTVSDGQLATTSAFLFTATTNAAGGWRQQYFGGTANDGQGADAANPAGDGVNNYFKRAFGLNPLAAVGNPAAVWPQVSRDTGAGTLGLTYTRATGSAVSDLGFQVLWSRDLQSWNSGGVTDTITASNPAAGTETHVGTVPLSLGSPIFLKLQVSRN